MSRFIHMQTWLVLALMLVICVPVSQAVTTWFDEPTQIMEVIQHGRDVEIADIDSDGDFDIVYTSRMDDFGNVVLLINVAHGEFVPIILDGNFVGVIDVEIADLDRDGDLDVVAGGTNKIKWYRNDGYNQFSAFLIRFHTSETDAVKLADLNNDGELDVIACSHLNDTIACFINDGSEHFTVSVIADSCDGVIDVGVADLDVDGDLDVIAAASDADELVWYENTNEFPFPSHVLGTDHDRINGVEPGDFDGDGDTDIGVAVYGDDQYLLYENDGAGTFTMVVLEENVTGARDVRMIDIDDDGDDDLFAWADYVHDIFWYNSDSNGMYVQHSIDCDLIGFKGMAVGDIDGDDLPDIAGMAANLMNVYELHWWRANRNDQWTEHGVDNGINGASDVEAADFDLDGDLDLIGAATGGDKIFLYTNAGNQFFEESLLVDLAGPYALWVDDMDADSFPDFLCASSELNDIRLYLNNGDMTFTEYVVDDYLHQTRSVHAFDMDGDDDLDIVATARMSNDVVWYENRGTHFTPHVVDSQFAGAIDAVGVDFDQDGYTDILACAQLQGQVVWYQNDGTQSFIRHVIGSSLDGARSVVSADLDNDGDLDVAAAMTEAHTVTWWENDGHQLFTAHPLLTDVDEPYDIVARDLNGDRYCDLLVSIQADDSLMWLENDTQGNFIPHLLDGDFERPRGMCVADLNNDGRMDLIGAANFESQIQWWENCFANLPGPLTLTVSSETDPVIVPADGGNIPFHVRLERSGSMEAFDAWISVMNLTTYNSSTPHVFPNLSLEPGIYNYSLNQTVPAYAFSGDYLLSVFIGMYPWMVWYYDGFAFHKEEDSGRGWQMDVHVTNSNSYWPVAGTFAGQEGMSVVSGESRNEVENDLPVQYALSPAYPNPFNPATVVAVDLPETANLTVTVYNIAGQQVATLADGSFTAGTHRFTFDASSLTSGLYFVHASVPGQLNEVQKVTLMK